VGSDGDSSIAGWRRFRGGHSAGHQSILRVRVVSVGESVFCVVRDGLLGESVDDAAVTDGDSSDSPSAMCGRRR